MGMLEAATLSMTLNNGVKRYVLTAATGSVSPPQRPGTCIDKNYRVVKSFEHSFVCSGTPGEPAPFAYRHLFVLSGQLILIVDTLPRPDLVSDLVCAYPNILHAIFVILSSAHSYTEGRIIAIHERLAKRKHRWGW